MTVAKSLRQISPLIIVVEAIAQARGGWYANQSMARQSQMMRQQRAAQQRQAAQAQQRRQQQTMQRQRLQQQRAAHAASKAAAAKSRPDSKAACSAEHAAEAAGNCQQTCRYAESSTATKLD